MRACPNCGQQNPDGAFICAHCGSSIQSLPQLEQLDRTPLDMRPQPAAPVTQGGGCGVVLGIAYLILAAIVVSSQRIGNAGLLVELGFLGVGYLGPMIYFLTQERTRSIGWGMAIGLVVLGACAACAWLAARSCFGCVFPY